MATIALDRPRAVAERAPFLEGLFLATVFSVTFAKLQWEVAGTLSLSDVVTGLFLLAFLVYRVERFDGRLERAAVIALAFFVAFLLVYLIGWFNLETAQSLAQWAKGMVKFLLHFLFLVAGISLIARRGVQFYWLTLGAFVLAAAVSVAFDGVCAAVVLFFAYLMPALIVAVTGPKSYAVVSVIMPQSAGAAKSEPTAQVSNW